MQHAEHYLVTEPGTTPLLPGQRLSAAALRDAEDAFGMAAFDVLPVCDLVDDWLTDRARTGQRAGLDSAPRPSPAGDEETSVAELRRLAAVRLDRLARLRRHDTPDIVRRNERRMLLAAVRALAAERTRLTADAA